MIYNQYTLRTTDRDALQQKLNDANIGNMVYYPVPLHIQKCFKNLGYKEGSLPETEKAANEVLSIPIYPNLSQSDLEYVIETINS